MPAHTCAFNSETGCRTRFRKRHSGRSGEESFLSSCLLHQVPDHMQVEFDEFFRVMMVTVMKKNYVVSDGWISGREERLIWATWWVLAARGLELPSFLSCPLIWEVPPAEGISLLSWLPSQAVSDPARKFADCNRRVNQLFLKQAACLRALLVKSDSVLKTN